MHRNVSVKDYGRNIQLVAEIKLLWQKNKLEDTTDDINKALETRKESWDEQKRTIHDSNRKLHSIVTGWKVNMETLSS